MLTTCVSSTLLYPTALKASMSSCLTLEGLAIILKLLWTSEAALSLAASNGLLFHVCPSFLDNLRAGIIFTPVSLNWVARATNLWMVDNSRSKRSSLSKVELLVAEPGHLRDCVPTMVKGGRYPKLRGKKYRIIIQNQMNIIGITNSSDAFTNLFP